MFQLLAPPFACHGLCLPVLDFISVTILLRLFYIFLLYFHFVLSVSTSSFRSLIVFKMFQGT